MCHLFPANVITGIVCTSAAEGTRAQYLFRFLTFYFNDFLTCLSDVMQACGFSKCYTYTGAARLYRSSSLMLQFFLFIAMKVFAAHAQQASHRLTALHLEQK